MGLLRNRKTVFVDADILVIGGGIGRVWGNAYESRYWGRDLKIVVRRERRTSSAAALLRRVFTPSTATWACNGERTSPRTIVRYARNDLMGLVREDLGYDIARHVDCDGAHVRGMGPADHARTPRPVSTSAKASGRS